MIFFSLDKPNEICLEYQQYKEQQLDAFVTIFKKIVSKSLPLICQSKKKCQTLEKKCQMVS